MKKAIVVILVFLLLLACSPIPPAELAVVEPASESAPEHLTRVPIQESPETEQEVFIPGSPKPEPNIENQGLSFDLSIAESHPLDFDPKGPFYHSILKATSTNGLSFEKNENILFEHASVPDVLRLPDGRIALYAVDGAGRSKSGLLVVISDDDGKSWQIGSVQLTSAAGHVGLADPEVVLLPDSSIRMYYVIFPQRNNQAGNNEIWSAVSDDGIHFVEEEGIRFTYQQLTDPDVVKIGQQWFIYFSQGPRLVAASSIDGNIFTLEKTIREQGSVSNTVHVGNNQWRQYYCNSGIKSAISSNGLNWQDESGARIIASAGSMVCDPAPLKTNSGWILFYKESPE